MKLVNKWWHSEAEQGTPNSQFHESKSRIYYVCDHGKAKDYFNMCKYIFMFSDTNLTRNELTFGRIFWTILLDKGRVRYPGNVIVPLECAMEPKKAQGHWNSTIEGFSKGNCLIIIKYRHRFLYIGSSKQMVYEIPLMQHNALMTHR